MNDFELTVDEELSLAEMFAAVDAIGQKYQTAEEIEAFNTKLAQLAAEVLGTDEVTPQEA